MKTSINTTWALNLRQLKICDNYGATFLVMCNIYSSQKLDCLPSVLRVTTLDLILCLKEVDTYALNVYTYYHKLKSGKIMWKVAVDSNKSHKVLMMMITTTSSTSPTPRPTLSLTSEAFPLILEASARKRSLEVFSRSDLKIFSVESHNRTWTCLEGLKGCCLCRGRPQCCFSSPQSPWD